MHDFTLANAKARAYAESNMISRVEIIRRRPPKFNEETGTLSAATPEPIYTGKARLAVASGPVIVSTGDEDSYYSSGWLSIPVDTARVPIVDDLIRVVTHPTDLAQVGRIYQVRDVESGGALMASRRMSIVGVQGSQDWIYPSVLATAPAAATAAGGSITMTGA